MFKDWVYFADRDGRQFSMDGAEELVFYRRDLTSIASNDDSMSTAVFFKNLKIRRY